jgi:four helix bundle protein
MHNPTKEYDLEERLVDFALTNIDIVESLPKTKTCNHIGGQLVRSGTSPASNYSEAKSAESRRDFLHKMKIALKELRETRVWLHIVFKRSFVQPLRLVESALTECEELIRIFAKSILTAESNLRNKTQ